VLFKKYRRKKGKKDLLEKYVPELKMIALSYFHTYNNIKII